MADCCPFCGAELSFAAERCRDCNLSQDPGAEPALPVDDSTEEVAYEVTDWPVGSRLRLTGMLAERGIPWRWEPVLNLVVREDDEVGTEAALDEIEAEELGGGDIGAQLDNEPEVATDDDDADGDDADGDDADGDDADGEDADADGEDADGDGYDGADDEEDDEEDVEEEDDEEDEGDDGAVAQAAMADLFVAADRLMHEPESVAIAVDLDTAADVINASPAPFGIDDEVWSTIRRQAAAVRAALDEPESDEPDDADDLVGEEDAVASDGDPVDLAGDDSNADDDGDDQAMVDDALIAERAQALRDTLRPWV